jgi:histone H3/H4
MKESIKIGQEMRANTNMHVSKEAIKEYMTRVLDAVDPNMNELEQIALNDGRKTIMREHVVRYFGKHDVSTTHKKDKNNRWF